MCGSGWLLVRKVRKHIVMSADVRVDIYLYTAGEFVVLVYSV